MHYPLFSVTYDAPQNECDCVDDTARPDACDRPRLCAIATLNAQVDKRRRVAYYYAHRRLPAPGTFAPLLQQLADVGSDIGQVAHLIDERSLRLAYCAATSHPDFRWLARKKVA